MTCDTCGDELKSDEHNRITVRVDLPETTVDMPALACNACVASVKDSPK
jgi:hypothetical protein